MLTKLNILNMALIAILFAGLVVHSASATVETGPVSVHLPVGSASTVALPLE